MKRRRGDGVSAPEIPEPPKVACRFPLGVQVADGWSDDTLEPFVLLKVQEDEDVFWLGIHLDVVDALADELHAAAERARAKTVGTVWDIPDSLEGLT